MAFHSPLQLRTVSCLLGASGLLLSTVAASLALSPGTAAAFTHKPLCIGTTESPGVLAGNYRSGVTIDGACTVNDGPATIHGKLTISPGSSLVAAFGLNGRTGKGNSKLKVFGNIVIRAGATLIMGCDASSFPCLDDPNASAPTLSSVDVVQGNLLETKPLGVVVHDAKISGNVRQAGGGGGTTCDIPTTGIFGLFGSPVYSDYENSKIHGNVSITGVESCWMGVIRDGVAGSVTLTGNQLADPDAIEILSDQVAGNLACQGNSMTWDSSDETANLYPRMPEPNTVSGIRSGQCVLASPATEGGPSGPGPF
jgi:hypothetical protein